MRRLVILLVAVLVGAVAVPSVGVAPAQAQTTDLAAAEAEFVSRINEVRQRERLGPLTIHQELGDVARRWAQQMADADEISHNPNLAKQVSADWQKLGENVGVGMTVAKLHDAFVRSPAHYRNVVDADFTHIGVGVVVGRDGALFTTHQFMKLRAGATTKTTTAPTPPPAPSAPEQVAAPPAPTTTAEPPAAAAPEVAAARQPSGRLVLVLEQLRALDLT